ncbi:MAG TPA: signal peptidase I [Elusimicrobiota bacterium]|nr:signal peptidase I [Elusimicrobiota bacterium]
MKRWLFLFALGALGAWVVRGGMVEGIVVATASMEPTLPVGTHLFVNKAAYRFRAPRRGEIVVFPSPVGQKDMVKRIIAVEGDTVELRKKKVYLNDKPLDEPYVRHTRPDEILQGDNVAPRVVPRKRVFVLGDNRDQSGDSRDWVDPKTGEHVYFIHVNKLKGKLMGVQ